MTTSIILTQPTKRINVIVHPISTHVFLNCATESDYIHEKVNLVRE